jgi:hypothetical protein
MSGTPCSPEARSQRDFNFAEALQAVRSFLEATYPDVAIIPLGTGFHLELIITQGYRKIATVVVRVLLDTQSVDIRPILEVRVEPHYDGLTPDSDTTQLPPGVTITMAELPATLAQMLAVSLIMVRNTLVDRRDWLTTLIDEVGAIPNAPPVPPEEDDEEEDDDE